MKVLTYRLVLISILATAVIACAQDDPERVLRLHRRSLGGVDALLNLRTARLTYDLTVNGKPAGTQVNTYGEDGSFRYVIEGERWHSASFDGRLAYLINSSTRRVSSYHGPEGAGMDIYQFNRLRNMALLFPLMDAESKLGAVLSLKRRQRDTDPTIVTATYPDGVTREFTLSNDGTLLGDELMLETKGLNLTFATDYSDYRNTRGANLPGRILRSISGVIDAGGTVRPIDVTEVLTLRDAERNVAVDPDFFVPGRPQSVIVGTVQKLAGGLCIS
jgi:hypothetical protein